jgi:hypothetical protein
MAPAPVSSGASVDRVPSEAHRAGTRERVDGDEGCGRLERQLWAVRPSVVLPRRRPQRGLRRVSCPAHRASEALGSDRSRGCRRADHDPLRCTAHGPKPCAPEPPRDNGLTTNARKPRETGGPPGFDGSAKHPFQTRVRELNCITAGQPGFRKRVCPYTHNM